MYTDFMWFCLMIQAVADGTGKEDLIAALRRTLLLKVAAQLGCNKLAVGTCATRMAVRTVAMSAKGSGYALPGALQFTDSRSAEHQNPPNLDPSIVCVIYGDILGCMVGVVGFKAIANTRLHC